jgi:predicted alpha/beta hydrolase
VARSESIIGPIALVLPALGVNSRFYERFARRIAAAGLTCVTADLRGQGDSSPEPERHDGHGYRDIVETDLPQIVSGITGQFPNRPVWLIGHSLGGQLGLIFAGLNPTAVAGVALIATGSAWHGGFTGIRRSRNLVLSQLVGLISLTAGIWRGDLFGFGGRQSALLMRDWAAQVKTGRYAARGSDVDYEAALARVAVPALLVHVEGDTLAPSGCVEHLVGKVPRASVTRWNYTQKMAETHQLTHFSWARQSPGLAEHIVKWVLTN